MHLFQSPEEPDDSSKKEPSPDLFEGMIKGDSSEEASNSAANTGSGESDEGNGGSANTSGSEDNATGATVSGSGDEMTALTQKDPPPPVRPTTPSPPVVVEEQVRLVPRSSLTHEFLHFALKCTSLTFFSIFRV